HIHFPNAYLLGVRQVFGLAVSTGVMSPLVLAFKVMRQCRAPVRRKIVDWAGQGPPLAVGKIVHTAHEAGGIVRTIIPKNFVGRGAPLQARALLPVPGGGLTDLCPAVLLFQIEEPDVGSVRGPDWPIIEIDSHGQYITTRRIKLEALVEEE